ncbi:MAG TPA: RNA polymerase sigma factor [Acidimicrobiales bacterium]|nr:RNA polymerase sigma factor [Acidimicrobiales bacterium]
MAASDDTLLASFALGDPEAAAAFIRRHQRSVYGLARSMLGDPGLAEDVAQEAFIRAWRHAPAYDSRRGSVHTWLLAITRNLAIDAIRLRRPQPLDPEAITRLEVEAIGPGGLPEATAEVNAAMGELRHALAELPPEQRRALLLAALCGCTAKEISDTEGIAVGTAKTRIRAGLHKVRSTLSRHSTEAGQ